ncbi:hypothetical protein IPS60_21990 [Xanthomonas perforans]|uniref:hypothetical protein n=2 Tax=Xanthomonas perforans TaxID=442694 RepID=UPI000FFEB3B4|nr:hypothetical protein [Xanthomonas perforans]MBZ2436534.1 hypothetical protein [Xanthomonas perforans]MBZ2444472.1 hypothetical protein [Xanthomonas perforans]MBZ2483083.1 hypothetical protein [Xanthomonas perforans]MBZ2496127.1 hypothetical protein [Xanthomonas perforans]MBZ2509123.1 hypothetical protein [Xanthomonas perforans]
MSEFLSGGQGADHEDLHALRERCGELETALRSNVDAARMAELQRELAACRQRVLEVEQQQAREQDGRSEPEAREGLPEDVQSAANAVQAAAPVIEAAARAIELGDDGRQAFERAEVEQPRQEQDAEHTQSSGGSRERERLNPDIARFSELVEAHRTGAFSLIYDRSLDFGTGYRGERVAEHLPEHEPGLVDLAARHDARLLERDEAFTGDVAQHVEHDQGAAYVIEADGDRVMVPQVDGAELDIGDTVQVSRDQQGQYDIEAGHDYGR